MKVKPVLDRMADLAGVEIIAKWRMPNLCRSRKLSALFQYYKISNVIDIGANMGQTYDQMRHEIGFQGPIHSFEPDPDLSVRLLDRARSDPNWIVSNRAVGAAPGTLRLNKMSLPVFNSFRQPGPNQPPQVAGLNKVVETVEVEVVALDDLAPSFPDIAHSFVKIDTQGFDLEVLKGGRNILRQVPLLQTEVSFVGLYEGGPKAAESMEAFMELGFSVSDFFWVDGDKNFRAFEFDCIMVRAQAPG